MIRLRLSVETDAVVIGVDRGQEEGLQLMEVVVSKQFVCECQKFELL